MRGTRTYRLEVEGELSDAIGSSFPGMTTRRNNGNTMLVGPVRDQAELHGLLNRCLVLGLTLVSVNSSPNGLEALARRNTSGVLGALATARVVSKRNHLGERARPATPDAWPRHSLSAGDRNETRPRAVSARRLSA